MGFGNRQKVTTDGGPLCQWTHRLWRDLKSLIGNFISALYIFVYVNELVQIGNQIYMDLFWTKAGTGTAILKDEFLK